MTEFLQWNIHGLQANMEELDMLLSHIQPSVISLQETFRKENKTITFFPFFRLRNKWYFSQRLHSPSQFISTSHPTESAYKLASRHLFV